MLHAEPFETHLLSSELCVLFIYFLKGNCIGLEYHIILSKIHIIVIIKTKIIDQNKSCSNKNLLMTEDLTRRRSCAMNAMSLDTSRMNVQNFRRKIPRRSFIRRKVLWQPGMSQKMIQTLKMSRLTVR